MRTRGTPEAHANFTALVPKIFRFSDIDEFRSQIRNLNVDFTPLVRRIAAEQIILNLPGCDLNLIKSFPRIMDVQAASNCTVVGFPMEEGIPVRFNGVERGQPVILTGSSGAIYNVVEKVERQYTSIIFLPEIKDRGWPERGPNFKIFETSHASHRWLRTLVREILAVAGGFSGSPEAAKISLAMKESLLAGVDGAFMDVVPAKWTTRANSFRQFKIFQQVQQIVSANIGSPIYSADLAKELAVSVRTIHDAVLRYRGMSLHRYLRLRRLWLVRRQLYAGGHSVKASALAFGFWHLGDFAQSYRSQFGESPSQTLARSRKT
jgi:AraC-like DNA-binding protein